MGGYWQQVRAAGLTVPDDRPLGDLTAELTVLLGSPDPQARDDTAYPTLATWIDRGVYDDLLTGLGDGMAAGLTVGIGERGTDTVFRRSFSALILAECIERDTAQRLLPPAKIMEWGDRLATWYLRERDLRGFVPEKGWAHAIAHGADAIGALARSPHVEAPELTVLLDVLADRLMLEPAVLLVSGEPDRMAQAAVEILRRDRLTFPAVEEWVVRVGSAASSATGHTQDPYLLRGNAEAFLRAFYLQVAMGPRPPAIRPDLVLLLVDTLRRSNPHYLGAR